MLDLEVFMKERGLSGAGQSDEHVQPSDPLTHVEDASVRPALSGGAYELMRLGDVAAIMVRWPTGGGKTHVLCARTAAGPRAGYGSRVPFRSISSPMLSLSGAHSGGALRHHRPERA